MRAALIRIARRIRNTRLGAILRTIYHAAPVYWLLSRLFKLGFGFTAVVGLEPSRPVDRGPAPVGDEETLSQLYGESSLATEADTFVLYRIIGNDLIPRHRKGQSRANLFFILEHEPELPGCEKRFIVNRIVDPVEESAIIDLLENHGRPYLHIPFSIAEYARQTWDLKGLPEPGYTFSRQFDDLPADFRSRLYKRLYRHKNNYLINNNGARNTALRDGKERAKWVLPWDGNCFLTCEAWQEITDSISARPWHHYAIVPMARVTDHARLKEPGFRPVADQEPQILFRCDSSDVFDEEYYYGRRPKVELLWRIGVPGPWDEWALEPWDLPYPDYGPGAGAWMCAGWVARLPSGRPHLDSGSGSETRRLGARAEAVNDFLLQKDGEVISQRLSGATPLLCIADDTPNRQIEPKEADFQSLPAMWMAIQRIVARKHRRRSSRDVKRAEILLLSNYQLPFLLDSVPRDMYRLEMASLIDWLCADEGAKEVRRCLSSAGTLHNLFTALLSAKLEHFEDLSRNLMFAADRATALFGRSGNTEMVCKDEIHRLAWQALDVLASRCGEDLWANCIRPANFGEPVPVDLLPEGE
jgi:hypothetical protein